jgi:hypothetical protein
VRAATLAQPTFDSFRYGLTKDGNTQNTVLGALASPMAIQRVRFSVAIASQASPLISSLALPSGR